MKIFNGHSDIITDLHYRRLKGQEDIFRERYLPDFKRANIVGGIFVIWVDETQFEDKLSWVDGLLDSSKLLFEENKDVLNQVLSFDDYIRGKEEARINILLGMEGLDHIGDNLDLIDHYYYNFGVRHMSLTWNEENQLAKGPGFSGGLSDLAREAVRRIEELGIILDISHLNDDGFWDLIEIAKKPILASHSNARALANHRRNLSDDQLQALKNQGGYIGLNGFAQFISDYKDKQDLLGLVEQLKHMISIMGEDRVVFGFDFCDSLPREIMGSMVAEEERQLSSMAKGLSSEKDIPRLISFMRENGFTEESIEKIAYKNYERYLKKILK